MLLENYLTRQVKKIINTLEKLKIYKNVFKTITSDNGTEFAKNNNK